MKNKIQYIVIAILLAIIFFKSCDSEKKQVEVVVPEVKGKFEPSKPTKGKEITQQYIDSIKSTVKRSNNNEKYINDINTLYNENEALKEAYLNETDSLKIELMYLKAIQLHEFYKEFDDDNLNAMVKVISPGEVKLVSMDYTIKERKEKINIPTTKFRFLLGGGVGNSIQFDKTLFKANVGFQNAKGNILRASFDTEERIMLEYDISIFDIKK